MVRYVLASLTPVILLAAACLWGSVWSVVSLIYMTVFVALVDGLVPRALPAQDSAAALKTGAVLNLVLGLAHFPLLAVGVWALADADNLALIEKLPLALALGLFLGQIANSNAHELIHAPDRWARRLGKAVYVSLLFGHHASAHPKVHHVYVATDLDPNSARAGQGFYNFWPRAWLGSFRAGWLAENAARARSTRSRSPLSHPYLLYVAGAALAILAAYGLAGAAGVGVLIGLAGYAQMQLLLADYVQHYGLRRHSGPDGQLEPTGPAHSWNAPHWFSASMMLNAPRHSDHHLNPLRRFPALRLDEDSMPTWPYAMPVMATLALFPTRWRRVMDPRLKRWTSPDASKNTVRGASDADLAL